MIPTKAQFSNRIIQLSGTTFSNDKEWESAISELYDSLIPPQPPKEERIDYEKETKEMLNASLDSLTIRWSQYGRKVQTDVSASKGAIEWLRSFAQRVIASEGMISREEVKRIIDELILEAEASIRFHEEADKNGTEWDDEKNISTRMMHRQHKTSAKAWRTRINMKKYELGFAEDNFPASALEREQSV